MKNIYSKAILLLVPVMLTGCDYINKATLHQVSFEEYREKALKVDTNHPYTQVKVTGYTSAIDEVEEIYTYDAENKTWLASEDNTTDSKANKYIYDVKSDAKSLDLTLKEMVDEVVFKVGLSGSFEYSYTDKSAELKLQFIDKYGMITYYYYKVGSTVRHFEFSYSK